MWDVRSFTPDLSEFPDPPSYNRLRIAHTIVEDFDLPNFSDHSLFEDGLPFGVGLGYAPMSLASCTQA